MTDTMEEPGTELEPVTGGGIVEYDPTAVFQEGFLALAAITPGEVVPMATLEELAGRVSTLSRNSPWWLGDLLVYAAQNFGDDWHQLVDGIGHTHAEIMDRVELAEVFPGKERLIPTDNSPGLTWAQHKLFARAYVERGLKTKVKKLMKRAAEQGWDDDEIRAQVKELTVVDTTAKEDGEHDEAKSTILTLAVRVPADQGADAVAELDGMEKVLADMLIERGILVSEVRHRVSGVVPPSNEPPKKRGRPKKNPEPAETEEAE